MDNNTLGRIKKFAEQNFNKFGETGCIENVFHIDAVTPRSVEVSVATVWMDITGRFPLNDEQAVKEWGLANVVTFITEAQKYANIE